MASNFLLNLPLALVVLLLVFRFVPESRDEKDAGKLDLVGPRLRRLVSALSSRID